MTNKEKPVPQENVLPKQKRSEAIAWAAGNAGTSYGKMMLTLTDKQKQAIYIDSVGPFQNRFQTFRILSKPVEGLNIFHRQSPLFANLYSILYCHTALTYF